MKTLIRLFKERQIKEGIKPVKVVKLKTGLTTYIYSNGLVDVK